jgi:von Willebrand factor type A domain
MTFTNSLPKRLSSPRTAARLLAAGLFALLAVPACGASNGRHISDDDGGQQAGPGAGSGAANSGGFNPGNGEGGDVGEQACAETVAEPQVVPVSMFIAVDKSGSMDGGKWNDTLAAFTAFFTDPAADELGVALRFWPQGGCNENTCSVDSCAQPQIPLGSLADPAHEQALVNLFQATDPNGNTPMSAALGGATQWAMDQQTNAEAASRVVVILVTDGEPNGCQENTSAIAQIAGDAYTSADVLTFAVGLQGSNESDMDAIAAAGGTNSGFFIGSGNAQNDLIAALKEIQQTAVACTFAMPESSSPNEVVDPNKVNVTYTPTGSTDAVTIGQVGSEAECTGQDGGWYYDDPNDPALIQLCDSTCAAVQQDDGATLEVVLGCATIVQ